MKTATSRKGCINNPDLTYQAEPREVKLRKATNIYVYQVKKPITIAYNLNIAGSNNLTMPDNKKSN